MRTCFEITSGLRGVKTLGSISTLGITSASTSSPSDSDSSCVGFSVSSSGMILVFWYGCWERGSRNAMNEMIKFARSQKRSIGSDLGELPVEIPTVCVFLTAIHKCPQRSTITRTTRNIIAAYL